MMMTPHVISIWDDGDVVSLTVSEGSVKISDFPHPLLTVDYNERMEIIQFDMMQPIVETCLQAYVAWIVAGEHDTPTLLRYFTEALDARAAQANRS